MTPHSHAGVWGDGPIDLDLYRRADRVIALTENERARLAEAGVPDHRIRVLGHGVSVRGGGDARGSALGTASTVRSCSTSGAKRLQRVWLAARGGRDVWAERPDVHVVFAGPAEDGAPALATPAAA